jgi:phosphocarrier protein FPr/phosphocarrier protein
MAVLVIRSPLNGWSAPLAEVPDPVFAEGMMGEGVAIDPLEGTLFSPCDGEVVQLHRARHAVTVRTAEGVELLVHLGLETVALAGEGFEAFVRQGDQVKAGQKLISFDLDFLALKARSLLSPVVVANAEGFVVTGRRTGRLVEAGEPLFEVEAIAAPEAAPVQGDAVACRPVRITHAHGLHARPAGLIAAEARRLGVDVEAMLGERKAKARSPVALMGLGVRAGDEIVLCARGEAAEAALGRLADLIEREINAAPVHEAAPEPSAPAISGAGVIGGVRASPGLAVGPVFRLAPPELAPPPSSGDPAEERRALEAALAEVHAGIARRSRTARGPEREILAAHLELLADPELVEPALAAVAAGRSAGEAWRAVLGGQITLLRSLDEPRLAERAADLADLERQVLLALGAAAPPDAIPTTGSIVIAEDLGPSQMAGLKVVAGICTARGGPTSHVAILAAAAGLPMVVAAGDAVLEVPEGATVILDGDAGVLKTAPSPEDLKAASAEVDAAAVRRAAARAAAQAPARTADGHRIELFANVGSTVEAEAAVDNGAEGCGLLRTEFLFLDREAPPGEDEQVRAYQEIAAAFAPRPVIVRTLDVGADKPASWLVLPPAENPALAVRGVRVGLRHPELLTTQLRAILRAWPSADCRIMVPMVASVSELAAVRRSAGDASHALGRTEPFRLGVMIETPAAAVTSDLIAAEADFLSIGTNDLAQYALAMDRADPELAAEVDALHPAVLRLVRATVQGAAAHGRPVSVCGGLASDPAAVPILIGIGVGELSAAPATIPELKALMAGLTLGACRDLAERACAAASAAEVRALKLRQPSPAGADR